MRLPGRVQSSGLHEQNVTPAGTGEMFHQTGSFPGWRGAGRDPERHPERPPDGLRVRLADLYLVWSQSCK